MATAICLSLLFNVVYGACKVGFSRSAAVTGAWLLHAGFAASADEAIDRLRAARPGIVVRTEVRRALEELARRPAQEEIAHGSAPTAQDA